MKVVLSLGVGIAILTLFTYCFGSLGMKNIGLLLLSTANAWFILQEKKRIIILLKTFPKELSKIIAKNKVTFFLLSAGTLICGSLIFKSGWEVNGGLLFTEYRDAMWHLGLMKELVRMIPPLHPGFAPEPLINYHYFTHLFASVFLGFSFFKDLDFYFRIFPLFLTCLYGVALYNAGKLFIKSKTGIWLVLILGYFGSSLAYLLPLYFRNNNMYWHESSFWLSQPFSMVINPSFALSASLLLMCVLLVKMVCESRNKLLILPLTLIAGSLIEFKVYAGVLVMAGLLVAGLWEWWKNKNNLLIVAFIFSFILSLLIFLPTSGKEAGNFLVFLPGWFLRSMVESSDRVPIIDWILREETYLSQGNWLGILRFRFYELLIYLVGNFGVRIIGLIGAVFLLKKFFRPDSTAIFASVILTLGIIIPLFFVQNGSIANTLQFSYYSLILANILLVVILENIFVKKNKILLTIIIFSVTVSLAIPTSVKYLIDTLTTKSFVFINKNERESFEYLKTKTGREDIILVPGTQKFSDTLFVSSLSDRRLYYSDLLMAENTHQNFKLRTQLVSRFFKSQDRGWNTSFLKNNQIKYIYLEKTATPDFNENYFPVKNVFQNDETIIYKVI